MPLKFSRVIKSTLTGNEEIYMSPAVYEEHSNSDIGGVNNPDITNETNGSIARKTINFLSNLKLEAMALETFKVEF